MKMELSKVSIIKIEGGISFEGFFIEISNHSLRKLTFFGPYGGGKKVLFA